MIHSDDGLYSPSQEGVVSHIRKSNRSLDQSNHVVQFRALSFSPREGVELCCSSADQSKTDMQINNRRPVSLALNSCVRPESIKDNNSFFSSFPYSTNQTQNLIMNSSHPIVPLDTSPQPTADDSHSQLVHPPDSQPLLNSAAEQTDLLSIVEKFPLSSPNFRRPSPRPTVRYRQVGRISRLDQVCQHNRTPELAAKTKFFLQPGPSQERRDTANCWRL